MAGKQVENPETETEKFGEIDENEKRRMLLDILHHLNIHIVNRFWKKHTPWRWIWMNPKDPKKDVDIFITGDENEM